MNIKAFMKQAIAETKEVKLDRFDEPFVIEAVTEKENDNLKKAYTLTRTAKGGNRVKELDTDKYGDALLVRCIKEPDLHNAELQAYFGTTGDAAETLKAMLFAGEYATLTSEVLELNGFGDDDEEEIRDEVKK